jgi:hypothetical protein
MTWSSTTCSLMKARDTNLVTAWSAVAWIELATSACGCPRTARRWSSTDCRAMPPTHGRAALVALFTLMPGEVGEYRANFRLTSTSCACNPSWCYEDWLALISHGEMSNGGFISRKPNHAVDHRVHLYGGSRRPGRR